MDRGRGEGRGVSRREPGKRGVGVGRDSKDGVFDSTVMCI